MSHAVVAPQSRLLDRTREIGAKLAPKVIAFLATGLTASTLIGFLAAFGLAMPAPVAVAVVGSLSSVAAFIQRDNLLPLAPGQFSLKVLVFIFTTLSATTVVYFFGLFGVDLSPYATLIGFILTAIATILGYAKSDRVLINAGTYTPGQPSTITSL